MSFEREYQVFRTLKCVSRRFQEAPQHSQSYWPGFSIIYRKNPLSIHKQHHHHQHQVWTLNQQFLSKQQVREFPPRLESGAAASTTNHMQAPTWQCWLPLCAFKWGWVIGHPKVSIFSGPLICNLLILQECGCPNTFVCCWHNTNTMKFGHRKAEEIYEEERTIKSLRFSYMLRQVDFS